MRICRPFVVISGATIGVVAGLLLTPTTASAEALGWPPGAATVPPPPPLTGAAAPAPAATSPTARGPAPVIVGTLRVGTRGSAVTALQQRLKALAYDPGRLDGAFGSATQFAVFAFQKMQGMKPTGIVSADVLAALNHPAGPPSSGPDGVTIDLGRQLLTVYRGGSLVLISHISSGSGRAYCENGHCGSAITPRGTFSILWSRTGWETAPLGRLFNPQYFTTAGHAIHGSLSVPLYPASHGCVRIPMHTAAWFPTLVSKGTPVIVR